MLSALYSGPVRAATKCIAGWELLQSSLSIWSFLVPPSSALYSPTWLWGHSEP